MCINFNTEGINIYFLCPFACFFFLVLSSYASNESEFYKNPFVQNIIVSFGEMLAIIPHLISIFIDNKIYKKNTQSVQKSAKSNRKKLGFEYEYNNSEDDIPKITVYQMLYLGFIDCLQSLCFFYGNYYTQYQFYFWSSHIFFLCLFTKYLLFKRLYIHHVISFVIFIILDVLHIIIVIMDSNNYLFDNIIFVFLLISNICLSFELVYERRLMDYNYVSIYKLCFLVGIFTFFINLIISLIMTIIAHHLTNKPDFIFDYSDYFDSISGNVGREIYKIILYMFLTGLYNIFQFLTIKHLTPNHALITQIMLAFYCSVINIFYIEIDYSTYLLTVACHSMCILVLLFFLEIIELKCCGMDYETAHNIIKRSELDYDMRTFTTSTMGDVEDNGNLSRNSTISERSESIESIQ